jgi:hypothetical protein
MISNARRATWQRLLAEQQASGLSITAWCFQQDIREQTFYNWRKRLAKTEPTPSASPSQWLALAPAPTAAHGLTLQVGPGAITVTTGFDPHLLAEVVRVLTQC